VVYLDEPTTGLDPAKREDMWGVVRSLVGEGATLLLNTQEREEADALADEISVIDHGRVIAHGTPAQLKRIAGTQTIVVRPTDHDRVEDAMNVLLAVSGHEPESPTPGVLTVPVDGDAAFTAVVRHLDDAGIGVTELALRLPSLDEVFFTLTGRREAGRQPEEIAA
jgi:oleandomycin transport system ATP-binding protein